MKISVLFNSPGETAGPDDLDTLEQVRAVRQALDELGIESGEIHTDPDLPRFRALLKKNPGSTVFNLTDPLSGEGRFISLYPQILEQEGILYTGCSADSLYLTSNKLLAKKMMALGGISTPYWASSGMPGEVREGGSQTAGRFSYPGELFSPGRFIVKSVWEHGSAGLSADSVINASGERELADKLLSSGPGVFAEAFLSGREINIALLTDGRGGWTVLPPSEIIYRNARDPAPFLDYRSKWEEESEAYRDSSRTLEFLPEDASLLEELSRTALRCAALFSLNGYARVDFRLDTAGKPFVLEVNANPCLSPGGGFAAAAEKGGIGFTEMIHRIISDPGGLPRPGQDSIKA